MKIETLIQAIQNNPNDVDVVVRLVARLEGMLPNVETARGVATKLGLTWDREPSSTMLAWAWTVWPAVEDGRAVDLGTAVLPLLPAGQPFGQSELDTAYGAAVVAVAENRPDEYAAATASLGRMVAHNALVA